MASLTPYTGNLGIKNASHLLRRITFGGTRQEIDSYASMTATQALNNLFQDVPIPNPPIDPLTGETWLNPAAVQDVNTEGFLLRRYYLSWHLEQMRASGMSAKERIVYFLHTHLPVQYSIVTRSEQLYYQNALYRYYALGNFKTMFTKLTLDNAMLKYIDNFLNTAGSPNENYAREMMELYSIGKGEQIAPGDYTTYTEEDIQEAAKVISGYKLDNTFTNLDPDTGIPRGIIKTNSEGAAYLHHSGVKTFTDKFQNQQIQPNEFIGSYASEEATLQELDDLMDMIFSQNATAEFLCRKIYRQFVYYEINEEIENDIITPLAQTFRDNDYELTPVIRQLLASEHFFDADNGITTDDHIGAIIKSPIELVIGTLRFFNIEIPTDTEEFYNSYSKLLNMIDNQGMRFYEPVDVAGYSAYHQAPVYNRFWVTPNNMAHRYEFATLLINGMSSGLGFGLDIVDYVNNNISNPTDPNTILSELVTYMLPEPLPIDRYNYFLDILTSKFSVKHWKEEWEYSKESKDTSATRTQLENLITAIMQSPEYQLC